MSYSIATQIADRCHVAWSNRRVIREVYDALRRSSRRDPSLRDARHSAYRDALEQHTGNRDLVKAFNL